MQNPTDNSHGDLPSDGALLHSYVVEGSEGAFGMLVERYFELVLRTARRISGCPELAKEAAGTTFAILARKSQHLRGGNGLAGWLHKTATFEAAKALRSERRHRRKVVASAEAKELSPYYSDMKADLDSKQIWDDIARCLDRAMQALPIGDRQLIIERFYHDRTLKDIALDLEISEETAKKRSQRALHKLAAFLRRRGLASASVSVLAAGLGSQLGQPAVASAAAAGVAQSSLSVAPSVPFSTLLTNTFVTMNSVKSTTLCAATLLALALVPLSIQRLAIAREQRALLTIEEVNTQLRARKGLPKMEAFSPSSGGIASLLRRSGPTGNKAGGFDLVQLAEDLYAARNGGMQTMARKADVMRQTHGLLKFDHHEAHALLERIRTIDIASNKRELLFETVAEHFKRKHPDIVLNAYAEVFREAPADERSQQSMRMNSALGMLAHKDPAAALAWLEKAEADNLFESLQLNDDGKMRHRALACVFAGMLESNQEAALTFYETLGTEERIEIFWTVDVPAQRDLFARLARELPSPAAQQRALTIVATQLVHRDGLAQEVGDFVNGLSLEPDSQNHVVRSTALAASDGNALPDVLAWVSGYSDPEFADLNEAFILGKYENHDAQAVSEHFQERRGQGVSDAFIAEYIKSGQLV